MKIAEAKILHGVYHHREMVDDAIPYEAEELYWLTHVSFSEGKKWLGDDNKFQTYRDPSSDHYNGYFRTKYAVERSLSYLQGCGFISYSKIGLGTFRISVTGLGAETARELTTWLGRVNQSYRKHKDGVIWFLATVLVSLITSIITKSCPSTHAPNPSLNSDPAASGRVLSPRQSHLTSPLSTSAAAGPVSFFR